MNESADTAWPSGPTVIDKTDVPSAGVEISTIIMNLDDTCYGETVMFDLLTGDTIAEQRCEPDDLTARVQHAEWVWHLSGDNNGGGISFNTGFEHQGREDVAWVVNQRRQRKTGQR